ncbi:MAG: hypothetical protein KatS3mg129_1438 [Leptospiraceae bacterium]|nr:MAG: hypothetical protein KatS3mg129_1438 [Leptospiraceae bacterium]
MQTKTKLILLPLLIGVIFCKKGNDDEKLKLFALWNLLNNKNYIEIRFEQNSFSNKFLLKNNSDSDSYPEKAITPYKILICLPNVLGWEEGGELTIENAEYLYGSPTNSIHSANCGFLTEPIVIEPDKPAFVPLSIPILKKYKTIGFESMMFFYYFFREDTIKDKNFRIINLGYIYDDSLNDSFNILPEEVKLAYIPYKSVIKNQSYEEACHQNNSCSYHRKFYYDSFPNSPKEDLFGSSPLYKDGSYNTSKYIYIIYTPHYYKNSPDYDILFGPYGKYNLCDFNMTNYWCWESFGVKENETDKIQQWNNYINNNLPYSAKYELRYTDYAKEAPAGIETIKTDFTLYQENWKQLEYTKIFVYKNDIEYNTNSESIQKLIITIDPSNVFEWETEHPEWDYFDPVNDAPNPSIGKDLKIYLPRISVSVE